MSFRNSHLQTEVTFPLFHCRIKRVVHLLFLFAGSFFSSILKILEDKKSSSDQILQRDLGNEWDSWISYDSPF